MQFVIAQGGRVASASVAQSSTDSSQLDNCVISAIKRWHFPSPRGGGDVSVTYPFVFTAH